MPLNRRPCLRPEPGERVGREDRSRLRGDRPDDVAHRARDHRAQRRPRRGRADRHPPAWRAARAPAPPPDRRADRDRAVARPARHHVLPRRRPGARRRRSAARAADRALDDARLRARGDDVHPRRRRALHGAHDPRRGRGALRLRPPRACAARRPRRPRPSRASDSARLRRQEPAHLARRAHQSAARRGGRGRLGPADREPGGGELMGDIKVMREDLLPPKQPPRRHLISIGDLTADDVGRLLGTARSFERSLEREVKKLPTLRGRTIVNLFFESSTRTSSSFELAAKRLSADTMTVKSTGSSVDKGESLKDTALTLGAYDPDVIVIRHPHIGAPQLVARVTQAHVVNAGDGKHQHPTQALLDLYTIQEEFGRIAGLHVAIVGDVLHSRVARSNIQALALMGARVTLVGPPALLPRGIEAMGCEVAHEIDAIKAADVVYVLRMQRERMAEGANYVPSLREYTARWGVTPERLRPGQKVMHPGPMNRGVEIDARVADSKAALVVDQVRAGLVVRMAVLYDLLTTGPVGVATAVEVASAPWRVRCGRKCRVQHSNAAFVDAA